MPGKTTVDAASPPIRNEALVLLGLGTLAGAIAGLLEGLALSWSDVNTGAVAFFSAPPWDAVILLLAGTVAGGVLSVVPAIALSLATRNATPSSRVRVRLAWLTLTIVPALLVLTSRSSVEPLFEKVGLLHGPARESRPMLRPRR
jgi:hypothetical protein